MMSLTNLFHPYVFLFILLLNATSDAEALMSRCKNTPLSYTGSQYKYTQQVLLVKFKSKECIMQNGPFHNVIIIIDAQIGSMLMYVAEVELVELLYMLLATLINTYASYFHH